jgi:hypothetical protein
MQEELLSFVPSIVQDLVFGAGCEAVGGGGGHVHARRRCGCSNPAASSACVYGGVALLKNVTVETARTAGDGPLALTFTHVLKSEPYFSFR